MARRLLVFIILALALSLAGDGVPRVAAQGFFFQQSAPPPPPPPSSARPPPQQQQGFGSFLDRLFGGPRAQPQPYGYGYGYPPPPPPVQKRPVVREPPMPTVDVVDKDPNARKILVIGDFVASGLAWGLDQTFAEEPKLAIIDRSNGSSGLARPDFYDWNKQLPALLNAEQPDIVVVAIGANDRQQVRAGAARFNIRTPDWEKIYGQRIDGIAETLRVYGRPFFWMGVPPMRTSSVNDDMDYINGLLKARVEAGGGHFVDIWDGFTNEEGRYVGSGPDVDGQVRALRTGDGINFTKAGRLKLAFYISREVRKQTGVGAGTVDLLPAVSASSHIEIGPDGKKRLVGPVISLSDPQPGANAALAGGDAVTPPGPDSLQYKLVVKGDALPGTTGRVDDFTWPPVREAMPIVIAPPAPPAKPPVPVASPAKTKPSPTKTN